MTARVAVSNVRFVPSSVHDAAEGLEGWVSFRYGDLLLDGIALRRTREGRWRLSFPERRDRHGRAYPYVRPLDAEARRALEAQVLEAIA